MKYLLKCYLFNKHPDYTHSKTFGYICWPNLGPTTNSKFNTAHYHVSVLGIVRITMGIYAFILPRPVCISHLMCYCLMRILLFQTQSYSIKTHWPIAKFLNLFFYAVYHSNAPHRPIAIIHSTHRPIVTTFLVHEFISSHLTHFI